jgi:hypothetical protein
MSLYTAIEEVKWSDMRNKVAKVNPNLASAIDEIKNPPPLLLAKYPFGSNLVNAGTIMLPLKNGRVVPISDQNVDSNIKKMLGYCSIPVGIWLNTVGETYMNFGETRVPLSVYRPGFVCGVCEIMEPNRQLSRRAWDLSIGAKSIFTLAKLGDVNGFKRLEKTLKARSIPTPKNVFEHFNIFASIAASKNAKVDWQSEILFFTTDWFKEHSADKNWVGFSHQLIRGEWLRCTPLRHKITFELLGRVFASVQTSNNMRSNAYLIDTVMHLIAVGVGANTAFTAITNNETYAPIDLIQKELIQSYGLKQYIPTIMGPYVLQQDDFDLPVYYSMQLPTMLGSSPNLRKPHSVLEDMRTVKKLLETLRNFLENSNHPFFDFIKNLEFEFFHPATDYINNIKSTDEIVKGDKRLIEYSDKRERIFCASSSFLNGCIRITKRKNDTCWR